LVGTKTEPNLST